MDTLKPIPISEQNQASAAEEIETERPEPSTPTPVGKGKERQTQTGQAQIRKSINEYLQTLGPGTNSPLVETIGNLTDDNLTVEGMTTMTLVLSLPHFFIFTYILRSLFLGTRSFVQC